jgi:hypothetical protein
VTGPLPDLEAPPAGTECPDCGEQLRIAGFCASCFERSMQDRERAIEALLDEARRGARTWQLGRAVRA